MKSKLWRCYNEDLFDKLNVTLSQKKSSFQQEVTKFIEKYVEENYMEDENGEKEK